MESSLEVADQHIHIHIETTCLSACVAQHTATTKRKGRDRIRIIVGCTSTRTKRDTMALVVTAPVPQRLP